MFDGGVDESTLDEAWERIILERSVEERRGRLATECIDILGVEPGRERVDLYGIVLLMIRGERSMAWR